MLDIKHYTIFDSNYNLVETKEISSNGYVSHTKFDEFGNILYVAKEGHWSVREYIYYSQIETKTVHSKILYHEASNGEWCKYHYDFLDDGVLVQEWTYSTGNTGKCLYRDDGSSLIVDFKTDTYFTLPVDFEINILDDDFGINKPISSIEICTKLIPTETLIKNRDDWLL